MTKLFKKKKREKEHLLLFQRSLVQFSANTWRITAVLFSSKEFNAFFCPEDIRYTYVACTTMQSKHL